MDDPRLDPSFNEPPRRTYRVWLWIGGVLACLICLTLLMVSVPTAAVVGMINQTSTAYGTATERAENRARMTEKAATAQAFDDRFAKPRADWTMIFDETFGSNMHGWDITPNYGDRVTLRPQVMNGHYIYNIDQLRNGGHLFIERPDDLLAVEVDEFYLSVDARQNSTGAKGDSFGLVFRQVDHETYILFQINNRGEACVLTFGEADDKADGPCDEPYTYVPLELNQLTVVTYHGSYIFLVNGQMIGRIDDLPLRKGRVGIFVNVSDAPATFEFDNFKMYVPPS